MGALVRRDSGKAEVGFVTHNRSTFAERGEGGGGKCGREEGVLTP